MADYSAQQVMDIIGAVMAWKGKYDSAAEEHQRRLLPGFVASCQEEAHERLAGQYRRELETINAGLLTDKESALALIPAELRFQKDIAKLIVDTNYLTS